MPRTKPNPAREPQKEPRPRRPRRSEGYVPVKPEDRKPRHFEKPGAASAEGKKGGRPAGAKSVISEAKHKFLAMTGQTPLEFLTAVYRNQLYSDYDVEVIDEAKGLARVWPKLGPDGKLEAEHIPVEIDKRIAAATAAAPYVHRKMPIGIDGGEGKPLAFISADRLAELKDEDLGKLLEIMGRLGIGAEFAGGEAPAPKLED